jgi:pimeloyl-ACP methyl ester carboxylesterase
MSTRASIAFGLALFATVWPCTLAAGGAASALATEDHMVESGDPGIRLFIRNKHPVAMTQFRSQRTLLYVHGATQAASSTFDLQVNGESWMDYIARQGYDIYLEDLRGYGRSTRPPEFAQPANEDPPVVRTNVAVRDLAAAVNFVLTHRKLSSLNLMEWSWGTVLTGRYASEHKGKVHRLVLFAPIWLHEPPTQGPLPPLGAYRTWTMDDQRKALQAGAPETRKDELLHSLPQSRMEPASVWRSVGRSSRLTGTNLSFWGQTARFDLSDLPALATLTPREHQVLALVRIGLMNKQIAFELGTSEKTVKAHRTHLLAKMGVSTATALVTLLSHAESLGLGHQVGSSRGYERRPRVTGA